MTYSKLFSILTVMIGSALALPASAANFSFKIESLFPEDSLKPKLDTVLLVQEEVEYIPNEPNEVIQDRLSCVESEIPLTFNPFVRSFVDYFTIRNRKYTRTMISRENVYFPIYERYLKKHNMPQELKYLSIVESGLNPKAASWAGAVGLWQFIRTTGKEYGLDQNQYIDERMDPEKATEAACRFLKRLHNYYGDWELAMAAYNCGPGNVNKAIRRAGGGKKTFWQVFPYLPKETRSYVPSMTAVIYAMHYAPEHNIFSDSILYAAPTEHLVINQPLDLVRLAEELHIAPEKLMALNPEIKKPELPETIKNYKLRVPAHTTALLKTDQECILLAAMPASRLPDPIKDLVPGDTPALLASATTADSAEQKTTYIVKRGDNLVRIALRHQVTVAQLKEWNKIDSNNIQPDQELTIVVPASEPTTLLASAAHAPAKTAQTSTKTTMPAKQVEKVKQIHRVQPGDTLWEISQKYNGITVEQIKKANNLKSNKLKPGQKLIIS
ncbi:LysM peptidoglycan-binding domain-containing protein [Pontibacter qinzhouensis]|uniref:LysM peptidoglycan-binding domain-containing protein n=1 Tax=Pontibacter qinzhouensis TaxID=2603253 RepID=A0A5C8K8H1_9BACT|nr:lytic transglycosylase domain-containing protein [Pontibacter qinzhouensis]TXK46042.1 LysM peptidoglycan-binding domain-containing protein [Pontibacter qinzhouensis]